MNWKWTGSEMREIYKRRRFFIKYWTKVKLRSFSYLVLKLQSPRKGHCRAGAHSNNLHKERGNLISVQYVLNFCYFINGGNFKVYVFFSLFFILFFHISYWIKKIPSLSLCRLFLFSSFHFGWKCKRIRDTNKISPKIWELGFQTT